MKEEISIFKKSIKEDILSMPQKSLDISLIEENKSDLTFFNIDEEETNETLKTLKQAYVTTNYKEETILNLQSSLSKEKDTTSKEIKLESYKLYNEAIELVRKNNISLALEKVEEAQSKNPKDVEILNVRGLLNLLKCDFVKAFESFYTAQCYENNTLSREYVDVLSSEDYKTFLARYNHSIRFINEDLNQESIYILDNMTQDYPELIEPYVILALLYNKLGNEKKRDYYLEKLAIVDVENELLKNNKEDVKEKQSVETKKVKKGNKLIYVGVVALLIAAGSYFAHTNSKINDLNSQIQNNQDKLDKKEEELGKKEEELDKTNQELDEKNKELDEKDEVVKEEQELQVMSEDQLYMNGVQLNQVQNYEGAIKYFEKVVETGKQKKYISESIYQLALLNEKLKNNDEAIKYYKKYINTYTKEEKYYDDAFYQLGMLYYEMGQLENAQSTFYGLRSEVPNSMYNNSAVEDILKER